MIAEKNETIKKAVATLAKLSEDEKTRIAYDNRQKFIWDQTAREREAREKGREEERDRINLLISLLIRDNRIDELQRSTADPELQKQLLGEYHID
jgi:hypothetical protein